MINVDCLSIRLRRSTSIFRSKAEAALATTGGSKLGPVPCGRLQDVVAGVRVLRDRRALCRYRAEPARLVVLERLHKLCSGIHDERPVRRDRLADRLAAEHQDVKTLARPLGPLARGEGHHISAAEHGELAGPNWPATRPVPA